MIGARERSRFPAAEVHGRIPVSTHPAPPEPSAALEPPRAGQACACAPAARPAAPPRDRVVLFDGHCNFCNATVNFLIDRDPAGRLSFAALQSEAGRRLLADHGLPVPDVPDTMVFVDAGRALVRSDAALAAAKYLRFPWWLARVGLVVPRVVRDAVYRLVARNRYRWFGRTEACRLPTPDLRARFLD